MRILYLTRDINDCPDTLPDHTTHVLARMSQREGHHVEVVSAPTEVWDAQRLDTPKALPGKRHLVRGVPVMRLDRRDAANATARFAHWLGEQRFDIVHGVFSHPDDWPFACDANWFTRLVITLTDLPTASASAPHTSVGSWMRHADVHVALSAYSASLWQNVWSGSSFRALPHGVDLLALIRARKAQTDGIRAQSPPTLLCVGTGEQHSGVLELMKAFSMVDRPDLCLDVMDGVNGHSAYSQSVIAAVNSDHRVRQTFMQLPFSIATIAQPFDALCLPGQVPMAFSMLAHECAALGIPCFTNHLGANADALDAKASVQPIASADSSAWAAALEKWAHAFDRSQQPSMDAAVPLRIEEEAFFYEGLYRSLAFKRPR